MRRPRKRYTKEFKLEAIRLAESSNKPMAQIEQELGITNGLLGKWREKYKDEGPEAFPWKGNLNPTDERIRDLERENVRLRQEREILKKVLGIFSRENPLRFAFIEIHREEFPVVRMCALLGVSVSGY